MIKYILLFILFITAPIIGVYYAFYESNPINYFASFTSLTIPINEIKKPLNDIEYELISINEDVQTTKNEVRSILEMAYIENEEYRQQKSSIDKLVDKSREQTEESDIVLEQVLSNLLGEPIAIHDGDNSNIKIYTLTEAGYRGYMAKIKPYTSDALQLVLAEDKLMSNGETTSEAAKRTDAILAVNAGGFMKLNNGMLTPLGTTVVDGEIKIFSEDPKLSFVGFDTSGHLVGGKYETEDDLKEANILQGSSFRPTLLQDGEKVEITSDYANQKHPRTIVGNFSNGELLFIVIDGRNQGWSNGITLEEIQDKLLSFKVKDAFNLDGGGSSTFYFDGEVLNKPSDGKERPVTSNLVILP